MKSITDNIIKLIRKNVESGAYYFTMESLRKGNHVLELHLCASIDDSLDFARIIIGFFYKGRFWTDRKELFNERGFLDPDTSMGKPLVIEDFKIIQKNLLIESDKNNELTKYINDSGSSDFNPSIEFMYYGNCIISHECEGPFDDLDVEKLSIVFKNYQNKKLEIDGNWVRSLNEETQKCVDNYNTLCKLGNAPIDALLMLLYKAIENEYRKFYLYNIEEILVSARDLIKETEKWSNRDKKRLGLLYKNCSKMIKNRDKYNPGGLIAIHTLLYHLGLCNGLPVGTKNISFLSEDDLKLVKKFEHLIASLQRMAAERNKIIHDPSLGEENEPSPFDRTRYELIGLLKLFSRLDYKENK